MESFLSGDQTKKESDLLKKRLYLNYNKDVVQKKKQKHQNPFLPKIQRRYDRNNSPQKSQSISQSQIMDQNLSGIQKYFLSPQGKDYESQSQQRRINMSLRSGHKSLSEIDINLSQSRLRPTVSFKNQNQYSYLNSLQDLNSSVVKIDETMMSKINPNITNLQDSFNYEAKVLIEETTFQQKIQHKVLKLPKDLNVFEYIELLEKDPSLKDDFCYLNRRAKPYDFEIVEYNLVDPKNYMTISNRGITEHYNGDIDFITLRDWQRQYQVYHKLTTIDFFRIYRIWKLFKLWKRLISYLGIKKSQDKLKNSLFLLDPVFSQNILKIQNICHMQTQIGMFNTLYSQPMENENFVKDQRLFRDLESAKKIQFLNKELERLVQKTCQECLGKYKEQNRIPVDGQKSIPLLIGDESRKNMPFTISATIKAIQQRIKGFVQMVDYMNVNSKNDLIINQIDRFSQQLQVKQYNTFATNTSWIIFNVGLNKENEIACNPSIDQIQVIFNNIIDESQKLLIEKHEYFIRNDQIQSIISMEEESQQFPLNKIYESDNRYKRAKTHFETLLQKTIDLLKQYLQYLQPYMDIYLKNIHEEPLEDSIRISHFKQLVEIYNQENEDLQLIDVRKEDGLFFINAQEFKNSIKDCAMNSLDSFHEQLLVIFVNNLGSYNVQAQEIYQKLNWTVHETSVHFVDYFVQYIKIVGRANTFLNEKMEMLDNLNLLQKLLQSYKIKISENDKQKLTSTNIQINHMMIKIEDYQEQYENNLNKCYKKISKIIPELVAQLQSIQMSLNQEIFSTETSDIEEVLDLLKVIKVKIVAIKERMKTLKSHQMALNFEISLFEEIHAIEDQYRILHKIWQSNKEFQIFYKSIENTKIYELDMDKIDQEVQNLSKIMISITKQIENNEAGQEFKQKVNKVISTLEIIRPLRDKIFTKKQWDVINSLCEPFLGPSPFNNAQQATFTYSEIQDTNIHSVSSQLIEIWIHATKENELFQQLETLKLFWKKQKFVLVLYNNIKDNLQLNTDGEMDLKIEDNLIQLNNLISNKFCEPFKDDHFAGIQGLLDEIYLHQQNFNSLEKLLNFNSGQMGLQKESTQFKKAEAIWKSCVKKLKDVPFLRTWQDEQMRRQFIQTLRYNNRTFDQIQKALDDFLDKKREHFQRFFFLSNAELFHLISHVRNVNQLLPHLRKVFDSIWTLELDEHTGFATAMVSQQNEKLQLKSCVLRSSEVEELMSIVQEQMIYSIKSLLNKAVLLYDNENRNNWFLSFPCQVSLSVDYLHWIRMTESFYLLNGEDEEEEIEDLGSLEDFCLKIMLDLEDLGKMLVTKITPVQRTMCQAAITQNIHQRDIIIEMFKQKVYKTSDFFWQQQFKLYWLDENLFAEMMTSKINYGYEFLGAYLRLVITPLTDRCWMTTSLAFLNALAANPMGPAGTGKTEACKDFAKVLGKYCIVFNCSSQNTVKILEKLYIGQASTGSWLCLDEFNRIDVEVLSVVGQQMLIIKEALLTKAQHLNFFGKTVQVNFNMGTFVTFNIGYIGRAILPENVQNLLRPIAMVVPDYKLIAENILFSYGFSKASVLAQKISIFFRLVSDQVTQQLHYDFGMRTVKHVLDLANQMKANNLRENEMIIMKKCISDAQLSRLVGNDSKIFAELLNDLFPGIKLVITTRPNLPDLIIKHSKLLGFDLDDSQLSKVIELEQLIRARFGIILLGECSTGKSTILELVEQVLKDKDYKESGIPYKIQKYIINPRSMNLKNFYGQSDDMGNWTDGIGSYYLRTAANLIDDNVLQFMVYDGPVDSYWVENLNTSLDDSKILCLSSGERIKLNTNMKMFFETSEVTQVSPATISRCGVLHLAPKTISLQQTVNRFLSQQEIFKNPKLNIIGVTLKLVLPRIAYLEEKYDKETTIIDPNVHFLNQRQVLVTLRLIVSYLNDEIFKKILNKGWEGNITKSLLKIVYYCILVGMGSHLYFEYQEEMQQVMNDTYDHKDICKNPFSEVYLSFENNHEGEYLNIDKLIKKFSYNRNVPFFNMIVQTMDTERYHLLCNRLFALKQNILLIGYQGSGKTTIVQNTLKNLTSYQHVKISFNYQTKAHHVNTMFDKDLILQRRKGQVFMVPPSNMTALFVIDDLNMPVTEVYNSQEAIEFLRSTITQNGLYDLKDYNYKTIENINYFGVCATQGGGRSVISQRFTSQFSIFVLQQNIEKVAQSIFGQIMTSFFVQNYFKQELIEMVQSIVTASLNLLQKCSKTLISNYEKPHYIFNFRDMSRIVQGIMLSSPLSIQSDLSLIQFWSHECMRVFNDKLITEKDCNQTIGDIKDIAKLYLHGECGDVEEYFFLDILHRSMERSRRYFTFSDNMGKIGSIISDIQKVESSTSLMLFKEAYMHILRIVRITRLHQGHMLLVGHGGSGKRSLCNLASVVSDCQFYEVKIGVKYTLKDFRSELYGLIRKIIENPDHIIVCMHEKDLIFTEMLEDLNDMVNTGRVTGLQKEDQESIDNLLKSTFEEQEIETTFNPMEIIKNKITTQLHFFLLMQPGGGVLRKCIREYPGISSYFIINWMLPWPENSLNAVAEQMIFRTFDQNFDTNQIGMYSRCIAQIYQSSIQQIKPFFLETKRKVFITPKKFLDFINYYIKLIKTTKDNIKLQKNKFNKGLSKFSETNQQIMELKKKLTEIEPVLKEKNIKMKQMIKELTQEQYQANLVKLNVEQEANDINVQSEKIMIFKGEADQIYKDALPIFHNAIEQLDKLSRGDLSEIKMNNNPHNMVKMAVECVALFLNEKTEWDHIRKNILSDTSLLSKLKNMKAEHVNMANRLKIKEKLALNPNFIPEQLKSINNAAKSLCQWVHAMMNFIEVSEEIKAKKDICKQMDLQLATANSQLQQKQQQLDTVIKEVQNLEIIYNQNKTENEILDQEMKQAEDRLLRANQLTEGLEEEQERWRQLIHKLNDDLDVLLGDGLLTAAGITFYGPFTQKYRNLMYEIWFKKLRNMNIAFSNDFKMSTLLEDSLTITDWIQQGLASDLYSVQNGLLMTHSQMTPYLIDPQMQATIWIKNNNSNKDLIFVKSYKDNLLNIFEESIKNGKTLLIEECKESLPSLIMPVLLHQIFKVKGKNYIQIQDEQIEYNEKFRLFLTTKIMNPDFQPDIFLKTQVINFMITSQSLQEKFLEIVVLHEIPEDDKIRKELALSIQEDRQQIKVGQDKILDLLTNSKTMILDDVELIESLKISREISKAVLDKINVTLKKEAEINQGLQLYTPVAARGVNLYFTAQQLSFINPMYQFSLNHVKDIYLQVIENTQTEGDRIRQLLKSITEAILKNISRSLFHKHRRIFFFILATNIAMQDKTLDDAEFSYFIKGLKRTVNDVNKPPDFSFPEEDWIQLISLRSLVPSYITVVRSFQKFSNEWNAYLNNNNLLELDPPLDLKPFQKLVLVKIFRKDFLVEAIDQYIKNELGQMEEGGNDQLPQVFEELTHKKPLLMIAQQGEDPVVLFKNLFNDLKIPHDMYYILSLGQGQTQIAENTINLAMKQGGIVILQNCHLALSFIPIIEKRLEQLNDPLEQSDINLNFRLILTSAPTDIFPMSILLNAQKFTNEAQKGVKNNLQNIILNLNSLQIKTNQFNQSKYNKICFCVALFHVATQERRNFGSVGFTDQYFFSDIDLQLSFNQIKTIVDAETETINWEAIKYFVGQIIYGGRITDAWDNKILLSTIDSYLCADRVETGKTWDSMGTFKMTDGEMWPDLLRQIQNIPDQDTIQFFGINVNATLISQKQQVSEIFENFQLCSALKNTSQSVYNENDILISVTELTQKLPKMIDLKDKPLLSKAESVAIFAQEEIQRFNLLMKNIQFTIGQMNKVLNGEIALTQKLERFQQDLLFGQLPTWWKEFSYPTQKNFASWMDDLSKRADYFLTWANQGAMVRHWMSGLFYPQGFLTNVMQDYARKIKWPIDDVRFTFYVTNTISGENIRSVPMDGVYIYGLYTEGFKFQEGQSGKQYMSDIEFGQIYYQAPTIHFIPQLKQYIFTPDVVVPIYKITTKKGTLSTTGTSTNFITGINLLSNQQPQYWCLKGAAIYCQVPD